MTSGSKRNESGKCLFWSLLTGLWRDSSKCSSHSKHKFWLQIQLTKVFYSTVITKCKRVLHFAYTVWLIQSVWFSPQAVTTPLTHINQMIFITKKQIFSVWKQLNFATLFRWTPAFKWLTILFIRSQNYTNMNDESERMLKWCWPISGTI
jgi:hypothetical protein